MPNIKEKLNNAGIEPHNLKGLFAGKGLVMDADTGVPTPITAANASVPIELLTYLDPRVVEILTAKRTATEMFNERIIGDWSTEKRKYRLKEIIGNAAPYGDYSENGIADTNNEWVPNDYFRIQTIAKWGDLETAKNAEAKISLIADGQNSAATILSIMANRFYMYGVQGLSIYGILNHPLLPAFLTPANVGTSSDPITLWSAKGANDIYNDILSIVADLQEKSGGWIKDDSPFKLALPGSLNAQLAKVNQFGLSVNAMIKESYPNMKKIIVPEFSTATGDIVMITTEEVNGQETGECVSAIKAKTFRVIPDVSSDKQKWASSNAGFSLYLPFAISRMLVS